MAADGGCERDVVHKMNERGRAWGYLKSVLNKQTNKHDLLVKDDGPKNCIYKDLWSDIQGGVCAY